MKIILSTTICFVLGFQAKTQEKDTILDSHYSVVKDSNRVLLPELDDSTFCKSLHFVYIPDNLKQDANDYDSYYHLSFLFSIKKDGTVSYAKSKRNLRSFKKVNTAIINVLLRSKWKIIEPSRENIFYFQCNIQNGMIVNQTLNDYGKTQAKAICL